MRFNLKPKSEATITRYFNIRSSSSCQNVMLDGTGELKLEISVFEAEAVSVLTETIVVIFNR